MLNINTTKVIKSDAADLASGVATVLEGKALVAVYEGGELKVKHSTGAANEKFVGIAFNTVQPVDKLPFFDFLTTLPGVATIVLPYAPVGGAIRLVDTADNAVLTVGDPATAADKFSINATTVTVHASRKDHKFSVSFDMVPTIQQLQMLQGDTAPGVNVIRQLGRTGFIQIGEVETYEFDPLADWSNPTTVKLGADGRFTVGGSGTTVDCIVVRAPGAGKASLVLSINA